MRITLTTSAWIEHEPTWHAPNRSNSVTGETKITHRTAVWRRWLCGTLLAAGVSSVCAWERLVDVGGHRLRIECIGQGRPAVVLDHGLGGSASDWRHVRERLARTTQVCSYDRAGYLSLIHI